MREVNTGHTPTLYTLGFDDLQDVVKTVAFVFGLCIGPVGVIGILAPSGLVWLAQHFVTSGAFYVVATVRIAFGLILISVASASRKRCVGGRSRRWCEQATNIQADRYGSEGPESPRSITRE